MGETQEELKLGIGTEEVTALKPVKVKVEEVRVEEVGNKKAKKVICACKHPDKADLINISAVKYEKQGKLEISGLWVNKDGQGLIRKGSALAVFLQSNGAAVPEQLKGKEITTILDEKGYLAFKAY